VSERGGDDKSGIDGQAGGQARASGFNDRIRLRSFNGMLEAANRREPSTRARRKSVGYIVRPPRTRNERDAAPSCGLTGVLGLALGFSAVASAAEANLTVTVAGRTTTYAPASPRMPAATSVTIPDDVAYKRDMSSAPCPQRACSNGSPRRHAALCRQRWLCRNASGGAAAGAKRRDRVSRDRAVDAAWPPLKPEGGASAGAVLLVWLNPERARITPEQWPYQVARIEAVAPLAKRYPMIARRCRRTTRCGADTLCSKRTARSATR
jgi:hypothetical protein